MKIIIIIKCWMESDPGKKLNQKRHVLIAPSLCRKSAAFAETSATVAELAKRAAAMLDLPVAKTKIVCDGQVLPLELGRKCASWFLRYQYILGNLTTLHDGTGCLFLWCCLCVLKTKKGPREKRVKSFRSQSRTCYKDTDFFGFLWTR